VRVAHDKRKADDWSLVLTAADIEHDVRPAGHDWVVLVGDDDLEGALAALAAYDHEQRLAQIEPPTRLEYGPTFAALVYVAALLLFYGWVEALADTFAWESAGRAYASRIVAGEWWRTVTALTLHANFTHVLGNAVFGAVFGGALCRLVGPGTALWIMLLAGGGGNLLNAYLRGTAHASVGASTAVFGALGALAGLQSAHRYRFLAGKRKAWVPLGAAAAVLAMLGVGEETDIWAHLLGLIVGVAAGGAVVSVYDRPLRPAIEYSLAAAGFVAVALCWWLAFA
jgi:membrane associated rhomboid family serine protease